MTLVSKRPSPGVGVDVDEALEGADAGGVDERVDAAQVGGRFLDGVPARGLVGHVTGDGGGVRARLLGRFDETVLAPRQQRDRVAPLPEVDGDAPAQTTRRANDHCSHRYLLPVRARSPRIAQIKL